MTDMKSSTDADSIEFVKLLKNVSQLGSDADYFLWSKQTMNILKLAKYCDDKGTFVDHAKSANSRYLLFLSRH